MISCAITTSALGSLVFLYLFFRLVYGLDIAWAGKATLLVIMLIMGCIPLFVSYQAEQILGKVYPFYRYLLYFIFIMGIILFSGVVLRDLVLLGCKFINSVTSSWLNSGKINLGLILAAFLCSAYALYAGTKVPDVREVNIVSDKISKPLRIVYLSDIHIHRVIADNKVKAIVQKTNALNPDVVLLGGDIIDDDTQISAKTLALLKDLKAPSGIYFVTGNHEFYNGYQASIAALKAQGFKLLENDGVSLGEVYVAGIPDLFSGQAYKKEADAQRAFKLASNNQYKILMSHTPSDFNNETIFDLEISGHTHGGQIFPFHILTKAYNPYLSGLYHLENGALIYVSNGAGQWGPQMRFGAESEITLINLRPKEDENMQKAPIDTVFEQCEPNPYGKFFTGQTYLTMLSPNDKTFNAPIGNVTFEPKARTNWHKHSGGQILLVLSGEGRYQERGKEIQILHKGDVVRIAPDVEHWHGAAPNSWFTHISVETNVPNNVATWLEPVTDEEYK